MLLNLKRLRKSILGSGILWGSVVAFVFAFRVSPASATPKDLLPEFRVPAGGVLRESVDFWIRVYGKLTSHEGMIHDAKYPTLIYGEYDFSKIRERRPHFVKREKERLKKILLQLHRDGGVGRDPESKRVADLFKGIDDPSKFLNAAHYKRIRFQLGQKDQFLDGYH